MYVLCHVEPYRVTVSEERLHVLKQKAANKVLVRSPTLKYKLR